jgi:hypothetical protein
LIIAKPIVVDPCSQSKESLTALLEQSVQDLLDATQPNEKELAHAESP